MLELIKCAGCKEPLEPSARICLACGDRVTAQDLPAYWSYVSAGVFCVLASSYLLRDRRIEIIALAVGVALLAVVLSPKSESRRQSEMDRKLRGSKDFRSGKQFLGCDGRSGIAVERSQNKICLLSNDGRRVSRRVLSYRDILSVELIENGRTVLGLTRGTTPDAHQRVERGDDTSGVLATLTGDKAPGPGVWQIDLRIRMRNSPDPPHEVAFLSAAVDKGGVAYGTKNHLARGWYRAIDSLIRKAELEDLRARDRVWKFRTQ